MRNWGFQSTTEEGEKVGSPGGRLGGVNRGMNLKATKGIRGYMKKTSTNKEGATQSPTLRIPTSFSEKALLTMIESWTQECFFC